MSDDDARTRLREAALALFGRRGVARTSTRDILNAVGMKNPSAINYHFGSKAELVDDLVREILNRRDSVLQPQIDLAAREPHPAAEDWAALAVDWSLDVVSTERGCLLAHLYWEYDGHLKPAALEEFLASDRPLARAWKDAVTGVSFTPAMGRARPQRHRVAHARMDDGAQGQAEPRQGTVLLARQPDRVPPVPDRCLRRDPDRAELAPRGALALRLRALRPTNPNRRAEPDDAGIT